jgi:CYTH domain-containing protein
MTGEPVEIERKFRVRDLPTLEGLKAVHVQQGYLTLIDDSVELRLRRADDHHFMTLKSDGGLERLEYEIVIDRAQFETLWPATQGRWVVKTRHVGRLPSGEVFELDVFAGNLAQLLLVEVEFASLEAARSFIAPDWFGTDVTGDKRFKNKALSMMDAWQEPK